MDSDEKRALIERYLDAYNSFDIERMMEVVHSDIEFVNFSGEEVTASASGRSAFLSLAEQSKRLFASRKQTITKFEHGAEGALVEIAYTGVLPEDLPSGKKGGETLRLTGRSEFEFRDGKICRLSDYS